MKCEFCAVASCVPRENLALSLMLLPQLHVSLGTCQELAGGGGGGGVETESGSQLFETQEREGS